MDDSLPKYLNSPETAFFSKGHNLYGINQAHKEIREKGEALIVEGYMDVIAAHQSGFLNAVASLGTALTRDQGKLLLRYTHDVLLAYDSDAAGVNAALKGAEILRDLGCRVKILTVPAGKDPDEFLRSHHPEEFSRLALNAPGLIQYKLERLLKEKPSSTIAARVEIVNNLASDIIKTESLVEREGYIRLIANTLGITEEVVYAEIRRISAKTRKIGPFSDKSHANSHTNSGISDSEFANPGREAGFTGANPNSFSKVYRAEDLLLRLMLEEPKVIALVEEQLGWSSFTDQVHNQVLALIKETWLKGNWNPTNLITSIQDELLGNYLVQLNIKDSGVSNSLKAATDCIKVIKGEQLKEKINNLQEQARLMQNIGDIEGAMKLLQEINRLVKLSASDIRI